MLWANDYKQKSSNSKFVLPSSLRKDSHIWQKKGKFSSQAEFKQKLKKIREEEERRIFYVACSRAKKLLVLSHSRYRDRYDIENEKSKKKIVPFFKDLADFGNLKVLNQAGSDYLQDLIPGQAYTVEDSRIFKFLGGKKKISYPQLDFTEANQYIMARAGKDKKTDARPEEGKIRTKKKTINQNVFSLTSILDYLKCPAMYSYKYVMSLPQPLDESIKTGQKVHKLLEKATLAKLSLPEIGQQELIKLTTDEDIQNYLGFYARSPFFNVDQVERVWLEQLIYLKLSENIVTSKVDRLDKLDGGNYRIIDYKVAKCRNSKINISYMRQLAAYALACSEIWSVSIDRIECFLFFLKNNHQQSICFTPGHIKEIKQSFLEAISGIKSGNFSANKTKACSYCSYSRFCGL
ncbi:MAG: PD-(D/E)XK nuclease family protein [Actinomycetota bacterium]|nr:PD-(D/E)XK nuclease family protein [Actinomycetota bacterium]